MTGTPGTPVGVSRGQILSIGVKDTYRGCLPHPHAGDGNPRVVGPERAWPSEGRPPVIMTRERSPPLTVQVGCCL